MTSFSAGRHKKISNFPVDSPVRPRRLGRSTVRAVCFHPRRIYIRLGGGKRDRAAGIVTEFVTGARRLFLG
jgi:hypothetical protein